MVPPRTIKEHDTKISFELLSGMGKEDGHGGGINPGQDQTRTPTIHWRDRHEAIDVLPYHLVAYDCSGRQRHPTAAGVADPTEPSFVLK